MSFVCVYILKKQNQKKIKKKFKISKIFPKKEKNFPKKIFGLGTLDFLLTFSKKAHFFFQRFKDSLKSSFQNGT